MTEVKPPRRFSELSDDTRKFIRKLDADDLATLERMISLFRAVQGWCRINRWLAFTVLALLFLIVNFLDKVFAVFGAWFGNGVGQ